MSEKQKKSGGFSKVKINIASKHPLAKALKENSKVDTKQIKTKDKLLDGVIEPDIPFNLLRKTIQSSAILSGIINKIASSCDTGFKETSDKKLNELLAKLDVFEGIKNFAIFGNVFFEVLKNGGDEAIDTDIILTETIKIVDKGDDQGEHIVQKYGTNSQPFNNKEYIHIKRGSLTNKYYGDTIFIDCIESLVILYHIEQVYRKLFENGFIEPILLVDEESVLTQEQKDGITTFIKDYFRGIDNGFELGIISGKVKRLELTNKIDHNSFIALKKEIKEDIAIALSIPFDLLSGKNSNRATRDSSFEDFNLTTVLPLQTRFVRQLQKGLRLHFGDAVSQIELNAVDTKNQKEIMEVIDKAIRCGVMSIDDGMEYFGFEPSGLPENQIRKVYGSGSSQSSNSDNTDENGDLKQIQEEVKKIYKFKKLSGGNS